MPYIKMVQSKISRNVSTQLTCRICYTSNRSHFTGLRTCEDIRHLGNYEVFYCEACGNGFTTPDIPPDHYELLPDASDDRISSSANTLLRWFVNRRIQKLLDLLDIPKASLLDIGGGACAFANGVARRGHRVTVIEPNEKNAKFADVSHGVTFISEMFSEDLIKRGVLQPNSYDAVTMWHSLEHTSDPQEVLRTIHAILKPNGVLLISVPNLASLLARFGGNYWTYLDVPHHLCHFTQRGLKRLIKVNGLSLCRSYRFSIEYDPFGWYQTLLNVISRSHNYFYNSRKKRRADESYLRYPRWTKFITAIGPVLLPIVCVMSLVTLTANSPACVEIAVRKES
jgi:2-polyprenyl-3-methyl-5-hydroxy-6-metoxy-1,4-benzoquinol methylase